MNLSTSQIGPEVLGAVEGCDVQSLVHTTWFYIVGLKLDNVRQKLVLQTVCVMIFSEKKKVKIN